MTHKRDGANTLASYAAEMTRSGLLSAEEERALRGQVVEVIGRLLRRAQDAGTIRADITAEDVLLLEAAAGQAASALMGVVPELWRRYLDVIFDGLRADGAHPLPHPAPTAEQFEAIKPRRATA